VHSEAVGGVLVVDRLTIGVEQEGLLGGGDLGERRPRPWGHQEDAEVLEHVEVGLDGALGLALRPQRPLEGSDKGVYPGIGLRPRPAQFCAVTPLC
jgi:hypothetical protein